MSKVRNYFAQNNALVKTGRASFTMHLGRPHCLNAQVQGKFTHPNSRTNMGSGLLTWRVNLAARAYALRLTIICLLGLQVARLN